MAAKVQRGLEMFLILCYSSMKSAQNCGKIKHVKSVHLEKTFHLLYDPLHHDELLLLLLPEVPQLLLQPQLFSSRLILKCCQLKIRYFCSFGKKTLAERTNLLKKLPLHVFLARQNINS
jgi:hypothetical protein